MGLGMAGARVHSSPEQGEVHVVADLMAIAAVKSLEAQHSLPFCTPNTLQQFEMAI